MEKIEKICDSTDLSEKDGKLFGYLCRWGEEDYVKDECRRGAFAKTIRERIEKGKVLVRTVHKSKDGTVFRNVAIMRKATEDDEGLYTESDFLGTADAQQARDLVKGAGSALGLSMGAYIVQFRPKKPRGRILTELKLDEVTITDHPSWEGTLGLKAAEGTDPSTRQSAARTAERRERRRQIREIALREFAEEQKGG